MRDYNSNVICLQNSQTVTGLDYPARSGKATGVNSCTSPTSGLKTFGMPSGTLQNFRLKRERLTSSKDLFKSQIKLI